MSLEELKIGDEVNVYDKYKRDYRGFGNPQPGYHLKCKGTIAELKSEYILVDRGYKERFDILDFRVRRYRIFKACGSEVKFTPLPDKVAIDEAQKRKAHEEYMNSPAGKGEKASEERRKAGLTIKWEKVKQLLDAGKTPEEAAAKLNSTIWIVKGLMTRYKYKIREDDNEMAMMTKDVVKKMAADGMDTESIAKHFEASYPNAKASVIKAKVTMLLSGKSTRPKEPKEPKKAKTSEPDTKEYIIKHDEAVENISVPLPIPEDKAEQVEKMFEKMDKTKEKQRTGIGINPEFEKAFERVLSNTEEKHTKTIFVETDEKFIATIEEEEQLKLERDNLQFQNKLLGMREKDMEACRIKHKPLLKPKCLVGEASGREYSFLDSGIGISEGSFIVWEELEFVIAELQAVRDMKSA